PSLPLRLPCASPPPRCSGHKYIWDNRVSTLPPRVLSQPRKISPRGLAMSSGCDGSAQRRVRRQGVDDRPGPLLRARAQRVDRGRHRRDDRPSACVGEPHVQPGERRGRGAPPYERHDVRRRGAPAPAAPPHPEAPPPAALRGAPPPRILAT